MSLEVLLERKKERGYVLAKSDFLLSYGTSEGFATMVIESNC
jgi:hypothetical protein